MPLLHGYNFVRPAAAQRFMSDYRRAHAEAPLVTLSIVELLRRIRRKADLPRVFAVTGFDELFRICPDAEALSRYIHRLLHQQRTWLENRGFNIYFLLSRNTHFHEGRTLVLRLDSGATVDLSAIFGSCPLAAPDHYRSDWSVDS